MNAEPTAGQRWDEHASWWQAQFTDGADPEYTEQILPLVVEHLAGCRSVLEVGTGEGQVAREVRAAGATCVVGVDPSAAQARTAAARGGGVTVARATADNLPFAGESFDAAVVCLVLEHVDEAGAAIGEIARVVRPGGRFLLLLNHPLLQTPDSGWVIDHTVEPVEQYWQLGAYLRDAETFEEVEPGVVVRFLHRPLGFYVNTLIESGFALERLLEPAPPPGFLARAPEYEDARDIPRLMALVTRRTH